MKKSATLSIVLQLSSGADHQPISKILSEKLDHRFSTLDEGTKMFRSQFGLWDGDYTKLAENADLLKRKLSFIYKTISDSGITISDSLVEIAAFTYSDNQQILVPSLLLETCVRAQFSLSVFFFRSAEDAVESKDQLTKAVRVES